LGEIACWPMPEPALSRELRQWIFALLASTLGSVFALFLFLLLASEGFKTTGATALSLVAIWLTAGCPILFVYVVFFRKRFLLLSLAQQRLLLLVALLMPAPAFILTLLSIFGIYKG